MSPEARLMVETITSRMAQGAMSEPEQHLGTLVSGRVVCLCGWQSEHYALAADAAAEFYEHEAEARNKRERPGETG